MTAQEAWTGLVASVGGSEPGSGCAWNEAASFPPHATGGSNGAALNGVHPARGAVGRARRGGGWGREPLRPPQGARCAPGERAQERQVSANIGPGRRRGGVRSDPSRRGTAVLTLLNSKVPLSAE